MAKSIFDYFHDKKNLHFIERLFKAGVRVTSYKLQVTSNKLQGKIFVFTGGLESLTRDEAKEKVRALGGDASESVSKETSYVVAGTDPGEKYDCAKKLNVKIISEKQFLDLIK